MDAKEFKKLLRTLKMPVGTKVQDGYASWRKKGGHAGAKTLTKVREAAEATGFKKKSFESGGSPDGSNVGSESEYELNGVSLSFWSSYGVTASDNSFTVNVEVK